MDFAHRSSRVSRVCSSDLLATFAGTSLPLACWPSLHLFQPEQILSEASLLPDHILTSLLPNPHLMQPPSIDVNSRPDPMRLFRRSLVFGVCDCEATAADQMGCQAGMGVRWIVRVASGGVRSAVERGWAGKRQNGWHTSHQST